MTRREEIHRRVCAVFDLCAAERTPAGARDAALVSVLYGARVPREPALRLDREAYDVGSGVLRLPPGERSDDGHAALRAVDGAREAIERWVELRGDWPGPLLCPLDPSGSPLHRPLEGDHVTRLLARRAEAAEVDPLREARVRRLYRSPWWEPVR